MTEAGDLIGPGRLILVVGPSGSGKDTIIAGAKAACAGNPAIVFPRRVVTRPASSAENHDSIDAPGFDLMLREGAFAVWWQAHGLKYGIPRGIDDDIRAGRTVICNVSRGVIGDVQERYAKVIVVMVTVSTEILAARLAGRSRASDGAIEDRLARNDAFRDVAADHIIDNSGHAGTAIANFVKLVI